MTLNLLDKKGLGNINEYDDNQEIVIAKRILPYRIFLIKVTDMEFASHKAIEIIYVIQGKIKIQVRNNTWVLNKGDFHIINSNNAHCIHEVEGNHILLCFQIYPDYLEKEFGISDDSIFSYDIKDMKVRRNIEYALGLIYIESLNYKNDSDVDNTGMNILIDTIKYCLISKEYDEFMDMNHTAEYIVYDILEKYSDVSIEEDITLEKMALEYNISYSYLSRMFKTVIGINFTDYFIKQKLNKVIDLLINTKKTITDISFYSGFGDVKILNKHFQKYFLISPTKFRNRYTEEKIRRTNKSSFYNHHVQQFIGKIEIKNRDKNDKEAVLEDRTYNIDINSDTKIKLKTCEEVIDLNNIIDGDINSLGYSLNNYKFKNIILKIKLEHGKFYLVNKDGSLRKLSKSEITNLVKDLDRNKIVPIVQVDFISQNEKWFYKNGDIFYGKYYDRIQTSLDLISMIIGTYKLAKWKFELYIPEIDKLITKEKTSIILFKHIKDFSNILKEKFGESYCNWGLYIGQLEIMTKNQDISYIKEFQKIENKPGFYRVDLLYHHHKLPNEKKIPSLVNSLNNLVNQVKANLDIHSSDIRQKLIGELNYIVDNIESTKKYNILYYNLCLNIIMLNIKQNNFYMPSFKVIECGIECESNYDSFYNKFGIKSTFNYIYKFISMLKPEIISSDNGYIVTKGDDNLVILLYSDYTECYKYMDNFSDSNNMNSRKNINLKINGLKGNYKVTEYQINYNNGTFYKRFIENIGMETMTEEERFYVQSRSMPEMKVNVLNVDKTLEYSTELKLLDISLITIQSV